MRFRTQQTQPGHRCHWGEMGEPSDCAALHRVCDHRYCLPHLLSERLQHRRQVLHGPLLPHCLRPAWLVGDSCARQVPLSIPLTCCCINAYMPRWPAARPLAARGMLSLGKRRAHVPAEVESDLLCELPRRLGSAFPSFHHLPRLLLPSAEVPRMQCPPPTVAAATPMSPKSGAPALMPCFAGV